MEHHSPLNGQDNPGDPPLTERQMLEEELKELTGTLGNYAGEKQKICGKVHQSDETHDIAPETDATLLAAVHQEIHRRAKEEAAPRSALCLSGGGIRSATYSLGILQGLAARGMVPKFDFLSTVSGGGYIGSWLSAWIHRDQAGAEGVTKQIRGQRRGTNAGAASVSAPFAGTAPAGDAKPISYLRRYSNYLTPRLGISSGDTWAFVAIYLRNLLLNWAVLLPMLAVLLLVPRLVLTCCAQVQSFNASEAQWWFAGFWRNHKEMPVYDWVRLTTEALFLVPLFLLVLWLPSVRGAETQDRREKSARGRHVWVGIMVPVVICCLLATVGSFWRGIFEHELKQAIQSGDISKAPLFGGILPGLATYFAAAVIIGVIKRFRGGIRFSQWVGLVAAFEAMALVAHAVMWSLRHLLWLGDPVWYPRFHVIVYPAALMSVYVITLTVFVGLTSRRVRPVDDDDREWLARVMGYALFIALGWVVLASISLEGPEIVSWCSGLHMGLAPLIAGVIVLSALVGLLGGNSESSGARDGPRREGWIAQLQDRLPNFMAQIAVLAILVLLSTGLNRLLVSVSDASKDALHLSDPIADSTTPGATSTNESTSGRDWLKAPPPGEVLRCIDCANVLWIDLNPMSPSAAAPPDSEPAPATTSNWLTSLAEAVDMRDWWPWGYHEVTSVGALVVPPDALRGRRIIWPGANGMDVLYLLAVMAILSVAVMLLGMFMNFNRLSMHSTYRNRLVRAYLGASNPSRDSEDSLHPGSAANCGKSKEITTDPFTGFDPMDNLPMHHLRRGRHFTDSELDQLVGGSEPVWLKLARFWVSNSAAHPGLRARALFHVGEGKDDIIKAISNPRVNDPQLMEKVRQLVKKALKGLLKEQDLIKHSRFSGIADTPQKRREYLDLHRNDRAVIEIDRAHQALVVDGSSAFLNRLILESECFELAPSGQPSYFLKKIARPLRPFHVVNMALNLVNGRNLAWQQRKAASFVVTPLHSGFYGGYRPTVEYGGAITLGTAMTISGAAATPNMGYHSSPAVTFLMTLFNVRLGWWLGNPAARIGHSLTQRVARFIDFVTNPRYAPPAASSEGVEPYRLSTPRHSLRPLIDEALGRTSDDNPYLYLSDGGHFENLGIYEMVRRRCHYIVVIDASCDPEWRLEDLGGAVRKIGVDLGVPVEIQEGMTFPNEHREWQEYCAVGTIRYSQADAGAQDGRLIYIKPSRHRNDPVDVLNYSKMRATFPHESTVNQWFTESQFESYRRLGEATIDELMREYPGPNKMPYTPGQKFEVADFFDAVDLYLQHFKKMPHGTALPQFAYDDDVLREIKGNLTKNKGALEALPLDVTGAFALFDARDELLMVGTGIKPDRSVREAIREQLSKGPAVVQKAVRFVVYKTENPQKIEKIILDDYALQHAGDTPPGNP